MCKKKILYKFSIDIFLLENEKNPNPKYIIIIFKIIQKNVKKIVLLNHEFIVFDTNIISVILSTLFIKQKNKMLDLNDPNRNLCSNI